MILKEKIFLMNRMFYPSVYIFYFGLFLIFSYNQHDCVALMAARLPANYAALSYILNEVLLICFYN